MEVNPDRDREVLTMGPEATLRFWSNVDLGGQNECWLWRRKLYNGYGRFCPKRRIVSAHRVAYLLTHGEIGGLFVDHVCRNRACVNSAHLRAATARQNSIENSVSVTARNAAKRACLKGHAFTPENTINIPMGRECRTCKRERQIARRAAKKEMAHAEK